MRAVNLLPSDLRGAAPASAPSARPDARAEGIGAYVVLGALALCVAMLAVYVLATNNVKQKQADLDAVTAEATRRAARPPPSSSPTPTSRRWRTRASRPSAASPPPASTGSRRSRDLSRAMPADVKLAEPHRRHGPAGHDRRRRERSAARLDPGAGDQPRRLRARASPSVARMLSRAARRRRRDPRLALEVREAGDSRGHHRQSRVQRARTRPNFSAVVFFERSAALAAIAPAAGGRRDGVDGPGAEPQSRAPAPATDASAPPPASDAATPRRPQADGATSTTNSGADAP